MTTAPGDNRVIIAWDEHGRAIRGKKTVGLSSDSRVNDWTSPACGLIYAGELDGAGGAREISSLEDAVIRLRGRRALTNRLASLGNADPNVLPEGFEAHPIWVHLDYTNPNAISWVQLESGVPEEAEKICMDPSTWLPQSGLTLVKTTARENAIVLRLCGTNPLYGAAGTHSSRSRPTDDGVDASDPHISLRLFLSTDLLVTFRSSSCHIFASGEIRDRLRAEQGPRSASELFTDLCSGLIGRTRDYVHALDCELVALEERILTLHDQEEGVCASTRLRAFLGRFLPEAFYHRTHELRDVRARLAAVRRKVIGAERYLRPQELALAELVSMLRHSGAGRHQHSAVCELLSEEDQVRQK